jgi:hypothetical protein
VSAGTWWFEDASEHSPEEKIWKQERINKTRMKKIT